MQILILVLSVLVEVCLTLAAIVFFFRGREELGLGFFGVAMLVSISESLRRLAEKQ
jgi:hypothetical protein